jgi:hypothetical protein
MAIRNVSAMRNGGPARLSFGDAGRNRLACDRVDKRIRASGEKRGTA